jgi:hypothetical protein
MYSKIPSFWKTDLLTINHLASTAKAGQVRCLTYSAGNRPLWVFAYGEAEEHHPAANYNSACGGKDAACYVNRARKKPVVLLVGGIHGQETEGIAAINNMISLLETGVDLGGNRNDAVIEAARQVRLLLIPAANPDGRSHVVPESMIGCKKEDLEYWGQGTWKDGTLCKWPDCKKVHPILDAVEFLGGYFNENGVNLMHDQFFHPMAEETAALLHLMEDEFVDCALLLHGGSNSVNDLLQPDYVPIEINQAVRQLAIRCNSEAEKEGLHFNIRDLPGSPQGIAPPSFNLVCAMHHVGGAVCATFESNECLIDCPGEKQTHEKIYRGHMILFEQTFRQFAEKQMTK